MKKNNYIYLFGFTFWKQKNIKTFFKSFDSRDICFCKSLDDALRYNLSSSSQIFIWGKKDCKEVESYAKKHGIKIFRVEDGFIRSVTLGSDLTKGYSLVVDSRGIYFDPTQESDLEYLLQNHDFDDKLLQRAKKLRHYFIEKKLSKYNIHKDKDIVLPKQSSQIVVLVVGQVEDDASIFYGGNGMTNLELLQKVKLKKPNEFIVYKPHPDVLSGNRKGNINDKEALKYADIIMKDISLPSLLEICNEVHTITSLSGFEALLRGKEVYTYGIPFYAGWGLTIDEKLSPRRQRKLKLDELVAATYILYPKYMNPIDSTSCEVETLIMELDKEKNRYNNDIIYKVTIDTRNFISRKIQFLIKVILGE